MNKHQKLSELLLELESALIKTELWQKEPLDESLLNSLQPFSHDTLKVEQWLQFIFINKLEQVIQNNVHLPSPCSITPYVKEALKEHSQKDIICEVTLKIDQLLTD
ncbi:MAG TPA: anhydro-N-acetylmuramic acid kinase [Alphaproteobacteria bacterium]|nr:anhydro-N-acetylmuramic acid kinase [Alphaproteobacteria bacterium]